MRVVIQCAGTKNKTREGGGFRSASGKPMKFVARPDLAFRDKFDYARPDDAVNGQLTWRQKLTAYNSVEQGNPLQLLPAYCLYTNPIYALLVDRLGVDRVFILSAGWGLIRSNFLTPDYDITFSAARGIPDFVRRRRSDSMQDYCQLPSNGEDVLFLGGKDYLPLFCALTSRLSGTKCVAYNSSTVPKLAEGFMARRFVTARRTNWHYECAQLVAQGLWP